LADYLPVLLEPDMPLAEPGLLLALVLPVGPPVPLLALVLPPPEEADGEVELAFLAFLDFLAFFFLGASVPAAASPLAPEEDAAEGEVLVELEPVAPVELEPVAPVAPAAPVEPEPVVALLPVPEAPEEELPLAPEAPELEPAPGVEAEVPVPPAMPPSLPVPAPVEPVLLCAAGLAALAGSEVDDVLELCASAIEDTEAISTNDSDRKVDFNVMSYSSFFNLKLHHRCGRLRHLLCIANTG
jgi:hypothetical protein